VNHPDSRESEAVSSIAARLTGLAFDGDVWEEALSELRSLLGSEATLAYLPVRGPTHWMFEFRHVALKSPQFERIYDLFVKFVTGQDKKRRSWAAYDPLHTERAQRNLALHTSDLRWPGKLAHLYDKMGAPDMTPDQVRVLICDGPRLIGWVGALSYGRPIAKRKRKLLQDLVPALRARLGFDEILRDRELAKASLEAAMAAIELPCVLLDDKGRIQHANEAARLLGHGGEQPFSVSRGVLATPDDRYDVRPVLVRGIPKSSLVTVRSTGPGAARLASAARRWRLTPRQTSVLELVLAGLGNKQIAQRLGIVEGTVELHLTAIFRRARVNSRAELTARVWTQT
jgi:DNA-binding CsgD family transcriptional regulator